MNIDRITEKHLLIFSAITDILKIFADTEIGGQYDFNYEEIAKYLNSLKSVNDYWSSDTKEEIYETFTKDIYEGYPVWRMLKLTPWTSNMIEKSFTKDCEQLYNEECKKYKCLSCRYYKVINTELGPLDNCTYEEQHTYNISKSSSTGRKHWLPKRKEPFELKTQCLQYEKL